jgi:hypothetical protein
MPTLPFALVALLAVTAAGCSSPPSPAATHAGSAEDLSRGLLTQPGHSPCGVAQANPLSPDCIVAPDESGVTDGRLRGGAIPLAGGFRSPVAELASAGY